MLPLYKGAGGALQCVLRKDYFWKGYNARASETKESTFLNYELSALMFKGKRETACGADADEKNSN